MFMKKYTSKETVLEFIEINETKIKQEREYVDILCKKATRQINVMYRFKGILDVKEREAIYNTFMLSNFNYCPIVWYLCGKVTSKQI